MPRLMLSDEHWSKLKGMMLQENIYNKRDLRMVVEGMLYRLRVGCAWRDLPTCFGRWNSVYKKFKSGQKKVNGSRCLKRLPKSLIRSGYLSMAAMLKPINIAQAPKVLSHKQSVKAVQEIQLKFI